MSPLKPLPEFEEISLSVFPQNWGLCGRRQPQVLGDGRRAELGHSHSSPRRAGGLRARVRIKRGLPPPSTSGLPPPLVGAGDLPATEGALGSNSLSLSGSEEVQPTSELTGLNQDDLCYNPGESITVIAARDELLRALSRSCSATRTAASPPPPRTANPLPNSNGDPLHNSAPGGDQAPPFYQGPPDMGPQGRGAPPPDPTASPSARLLDLLTQNLLQLTNLYAQPPPAAAMQPTSAKLPVVSFPYLRLDPETG